MTLADFNLADVYVDPAWILLVLAWLVTMATFHAIRRYGVLRHVWHPALFVAATYVIILSAMILAIAL
ncbi:hypothetical protein ACVMIH_002490 [Bradyrhizobium sp. USDA 4503]